LANAYQKWPETVLSWILRKCKTKQWVFPEIKHISFNQMIKNYSNELKNRLAQFGKLKLYGFP